MLDNYRSVFRLEGSAAFSSASFVMRLPLALYPIGMVLLISLRTGHYSFAGALTGTYVVANGVGNPVLGRLVDRFGQTRLLLPLSLIHAAAMVTLAVLVLANAPDWSLLPAVAVGGFFYLAVGSLVRARWAHAAKEPSDLATAYSLESTIDEVIFVLGPLIATVVATQIDPTLVFVLAPAVVLAGAVWLWRLPQTAPPPHHRDAERSASALRNRGMPLLALAMTAIGAFFAAIEITMVAFCTRHGSAGISGAVLASFAAGSAASGFLYGARSWALPLLRRYLVQSLFFAALPPLFWLAPNVPVLAVIAFVIGLATAPTLITAMSLVERIVPNRSLTEGISWMTTGLGVGYGLAAAVTGHVADRNGLRWAFGLAVVAGVVELVLAAGLFQLLRGTPLPGDAAAGVVEAELDIAVG